MNAHLLVAALSHAVSTSSAPGPSAVAVVALVVAGLGLVWNVVQLVIRWPRLHAEMLVDARSDQRGVMQYLYEVRAINTGSEATTVWDVGVYSVALPDEERGVWSSAQRLRKTGLAHVVLGPDLPATIQAHGVLIWTFADEATRSRARDGDEIFGFVHRYRAGRYGRWNDSAKARLNRDRDHVEGPRHPRRSRVRKQWWLWTRKLRDPIVTYKSPRAEVRGQRRPPT